MTLREKLKQLNYRWKVFSRGECSKENCSAPVIGDPVFNSTKLCDRHFSEFFREICIQDEIELSVLEQMEFDLLVDEEIERRRAAGTLVSA